MAREFYSACKLVEAHIFQKLALPTVEESVWVH